MKRKVRLRDLQQVAHQTIDDALRDSGTEDDPIYEWEFSAAEIADSIATLFFATTSLSHANLERKITKIIENERCVHISIDSNSPLCGVKLCFCPIFGECNCAIILNNVSVSLTLRHLLHKRRLSKRGFDLSHLGASC